MNVDRLYHRQPYWTACGVFFGFPPCCIEAFIKGQQKKVFKKYPMLPSSGSGFVPCLKCAPLVQEDWPGFQQRIALSRRCPTPFPSEPSDTDLNRFFLAFTLELGFDPDDVLPTLRNSNDVKSLWQTLKHHESLKNTK